MFLLFKKTLLYVYGFQTLENTLPNIQFSILSCKLLVTNPDYRLTRMIWSQTLTSLKCNNFLIPNEPVRKYFLTNFYINYFLTIHLTIS